MSSIRMDDIEALSKRLESLQITNEALEEYKQSDTEMSTAPAPVPIMNMNEQAVMPKNIVPDPGWFDRNWTKFKDWWRDI